jgi:RNA polymerase sigma-70 factor (ECF subfamily)
MSTTDVNTPTSHAGPGVEAATTGAPSAEVLLTRVAAGDSAAFDDLYGQLQGQVFGVAVRLLIDRHQAQEVAQEAWLQVWQQAARFNPLRGSATAWVMRIAHARAVDRIRSANAARLRDTAATASNHLTASDVVVESALLSIEQSRLREQLPHLSDKQRQSIDLAYFGGLSLPAISELLALPLGTVKTRIRDGLLNLRALMDPPATTP